MTICDPSRLIDVKELSRMLNVGIRTVWRLQSSQKIPEPIRIGNSVRWRYEEIAEWISRGCPLPGKFPGKPR